MKSEDEQISEEISFGSFVVPDVVGEALKAWRAWEISLDSLGEPLLTSVNQGYDWPAREVMVGCCKGKKHDDSLTPMEGCGCGLHALASPLLLAKAGYVSMLGEGKTNMVWGEIAMWGRIIQGDSGIKSQFAYPTSLYIRPDLTLHGHGLRWWREATSKRYGVPVEIITHVMRPAKSSDELIFVPIKEDQIPNE